jgi:hypothetical protein
MIRNAQIARAAGTIRPIHDASIGISTFSTRIGKPFTILSKWATATKVNNIPEVKQYPLVAILLVS